MAGHTVALSIRFACTEYWAPVWCPAAGIAIAPVCAATRPCASTIATCRTAGFGSARFRESSASGAGIPPRISASPFGP